MHFQYEIGPDEYVASQILYVKLNGDRKRLQWALFSIFGGFFLLLVAWMQVKSTWIELLPVVVAGWWIYAGFLNLFPARYYRRAYETADLAGKRFMADMNEQEFQVAGDLCSWRVKWAAVRLKGENEKVVVICSAGTVFMFGKKYLTSDQQQELRRLSGLLSF